MDIDTTIKIIELSFTFLGLVLVIFGWIIPYNNSKKLDIQRRMFEIKLDQNRRKQELIRRQISDLYGPISAMINENNLMFQRILEQLGRNYVIPAGKGINWLSEDDKKIWIHYVNTYKIPIQLKMEEILKNNIHLLYKNEKPPCYDIFIDYALGWELLDNQKRNGVPNYYEYYYSYNYPKEFDVYIRNTLKILMEELVNLENEERNIVITSDKIKS